MALAKNGHFVDIDEIRNRKTASDFRVNNNDDDDDDDGAGGRSITDRR